MRDRDWHDHRSEGRGWDRDEGRRDGRDWGGREERSFGSQASWRGDRDYGRRGSEREVPAWSDHDTARVQGGGYRRQEQTPGGYDLRGGYERGGGYGRGDRQGQARWPQSSGEDYGRGYQGFDPYTSRFGDRWDYGGTEYRGSGRDERWRDDDRNWLDKAKDKVADMFSDDDRGMRGEHHGRGPKGYKRSDDRIREDVNDTLTYDAWLDASDVEVEVSDCEVTLNGTVNSRADKRRAEDCVERVSGVRHVQNNLRVKDATGEDRTSTTSTGAGRRGAGPTTGLVS